MTLTQKETTLLQDLKNQEKLCYDKYNKYSKDAHAEELKSLFGEIAAAEVYNNKAPEGGYPSFSDVGKEPIYDTREAAREVAAGTLADVRRAMRIDYFDDAELIAEQSRKFQG